MLKWIKPWGLEVGMVAACVQCSTWEGGAKGSGIQGQPCLHSEFEARPNDMRQSLLNKQTNDIYGYCQSRTECILHFEMPRAFCDWNRMLWPESGMFIMCFCLECSLVEAILEGSGNFGRWSLPRGSRLLGWVFEGMLSLSTSCCSVSWSSVMSCFVQLCYFLRARTAEEMFDSMGCSVAGSSVTENSVEVTPSLLSSSSG